jgi:hypothetical protein
MLFSLSWQCLEVYKTITVIYVTFITYIGVIGTTYAIYSVFRGEYAILYRGDCMLYVAVEQVNNTLVILKNNETLCFHTWRTTIYIDEQEAV